VGQKRTIIVSGSQIVTESDPKYILGKYLPENNEFLVCLENSIFAVKIGVTKKITVTRHTAEQIAEKLRLILENAVPGSLCRELEKIKYKKFKKIVNCKIKKIDSVEDWVAYSEKNFSESAKTKKLKKILGGKNA
jgi:hypothetical protein